MQHVDRNKKIFIFLGETGSGKSEIAINWALKMASSGGKVRFFDMDQTKPLFRSREVAALLRNSGIMMDADDQVLDAPVIPSGVFNNICSLDSYNILDVGGNASGANCLGQLAEAWGAAVFAAIVINVYRPFSQTKNELLVTTNDIAKAARLKKLSVISNPNFGARTTIADLAEGYRQTEKILWGTQYCAEILVTPSWLEQEARLLFPGISIMGIARYIKAPWEKAREGEKEDPYGENHD